MTELYGTGAFLMAASEIYKLCRQISHNKALFFIKVPAKALEHPGKPAFNIRMSGGANTRMYR